jgi:hypothetical protein
MSTRLYFDLAAVAAQARHAVLADRTRSTEHEAANNIAPQPALWFYRHGGGMYLSSNGKITSNDLAVGRPLLVSADTTNALTTPFIQPPDVDHKVALPLLQPQHRPLIDLLNTALTVGADYVALDPQTNAVGVGRRRRRTTRALPGRQYS